MKNKSCNKFLYLILCVIGLMFFVSGCKKNNTVTKAKTTPADTTPKLAFLLVDSQDTLAAQLWTVTMNGDTVKQIPINAPPGLSFNFFDDFGLGVLASPDKNTIISLFTNVSSGNAFFYKSNSNGSNFQKFFTSANAEITPQCFIDNLSVLYWGLTNNVNEGELRKVNTDGTGDQKINIAFPSDVHFNLGYFAKTTSDGKNIIFSMLTYADSTVTGSRIYETGIDGSNLTTIASSTNGNCLNVEAIVKNTILYYKYTFIGDGSPQTLWQMNIDGSNNHQVTLSLPNGIELFNGSFNLTPQANIIIENGKIYFAAIDVNQQQYIYSANLDGSNVKLFYTAPSGKYIFPGGII